MNELRIFIDPAWPQQHTDATWYLCDGGGRVLQHGHSEPRHWPGVRPAAASVGGEAGGKLASKASPPQPVSVILTGGQAACHRVRLPRGAAGRRPEVLAAALEDRLLAEPADCLLLPGCADAEGLTAVAVLARERLAGIVTLLHELGLEAVSVWADGQLLPRRDSRRAARLDGRLLLLPIGADGFAALDLPADAPGAAGTFAPLVPPSLPLLLAPGSVADGLADCLGCELQPEAESPQRFPLAAPPPGGFLVGEFAPPAARFVALRPLLPALRLAAGLAAVLAVLVVAEWAWLALQARQMRAAAVAVFRDAFPQAAVVDPALQMQRNIDARRRRLGEVGGGDLLAMLARLAADDSLRWQRFDYVDGRLEAELSLPETALAGLLGRLQAAGYRPELRDQQQADGQMRITLRLTGGGR